MRTELWSASGLTLEELAELFNRSFEAYVVPVQMSAPALLERLRVEGVDYTVSRVLAVDGEPAGLALLARRGERSRLAAMGITPGPAPRSAHSMNFNLPLGDTYRLAL